MIIYSIERGQNSHGIITFLNSIYFFYEQRVSNYIYLILILYEIALDHN